MKIAVQVYSVREHITDSESLLKALEEIKRIGYDGVEFAGYFDTDAETIKAKLDELGLVCVGSHNGLDDFKPDRLEKTIEFQNTLGTHLAGVGGAPHSTPDEAVMTGEILGAAEKYAKEKYGMRIYYHNHCEEFKPLENGLYPIDVIGERCSLEIDTYWSFHAGVDNRKLLSEKRIKSLRFTLKTALTESLPRLERVIAIFPPLSKRQRKSVWNGLLSKTIIPCRRALRTLQEALNILKALYKTQTAVSRIPPSIML